MNWHEKALREFHPTMMLINDIIDENRQVTMGMLHEELSIAKTTISKHLQRLEKLEIITIKKIITKKGKQLIISKVRE